MRFSAPLVAVFLSFVLGRTVAFSPSSMAENRRRRLLLSRLYMADQLPPPPSPSPNNDVPEVVANGNMPVPVRYSDFIKLVDADRVEKVTFSSDGTQLLGVDVNGIRL